MHPHDFMICCPRSIALEMKTLLHAFLALSMIAACLAADPAKRPNILWLIAEDVGPELGCYGTSQVSTPNLDQLAAEGVRYPRAYTTAPVCSTSRSAFMTGMYQTTIGAHNHRSHRDDGYQLPEGVRVLPELAMRLAPVPVVVAGEGPLDGWHASETRSARNLKQQGHLDAETLAPLRAAAAVVVVPSLFYETYCYAAAEALLDRRPVVASAIGAIPELVEHEVTGLLVPPGDADALGEAVERALIDAAATRWGEAGRERVAMKSDPRRHLEGLVAIYREALDRA